MQLTINNFAKISHAEITVDGITVIAGENNTGKSTVGKILFSMFNSTSDIENKITKQRSTEIYSTCRRILQGYFAHAGSSKHSVIRNRHSVAARRISSTLESIENVDKIILDALKPYTTKSERDQEDFKEVILEIKKAVLSIMELPKDAVILEMLSRYFNSVFYNQMIPLTKCEAKTFLELNIKGKKLHIEFANDKCSHFSANVSILHQAVYIDSPLILDKLSDIETSSATEDHLWNLLSNAPGENIMDGVFESVRSKEKLEAVSKLLQTVVDGKIIENQDNEFYLQLHEGNEPVYFNNLSTGLKSFVILKMLLEKGAVKDKDVLILDEPEIHLHPQWQIVYAELIVLLQKYFDLSIIVTTHSPYFLDAINLYSTKHKINTKVNYYLSSIKNNIACIECVNDNIDLIYNKMASPIQILDSLRYELNNT